eukprot:CAMPEP_0201884656 /NCGR_PEP_ID=MMETSP0902-20130614/17481_1 /ASSEMBLY_ACC=CAM_ASM_000551 /TAXON_ID=420261 /ORGANISM="Thalassiosira antarctica, Strain CCMP982" /LENGTH=253 /DNA_ID=CAMNT_0048413653 /DNA_START=200 /DNA_END=961 /DNA_ORIENTATION=+
MQLLVTATSYSAEANPKTRAQYSKVSQTKDDKLSTTWPSRLAMMVIYTPPVTASVALLVLGLQGVNLPAGTLTIPSPSLAAVLCAIQFGKRCLEVLFLHKYSGRTDRGTPIMISVYYTLMAVLIAYASGDGNENLDMMTVGTFIFAVGITGNFYHHYLLANLRSASNRNTNTSKYVVPRGGFFSYVAAPHYFFELIGWLGIAIVSNHLNVYLVFAAMSSYLGGRSVAQNDFNRKTFGEKEWPRDRKNLVPFVF